MFYYHIYVNFGGQNKNGYSLWFKSDNDLHDDEDAILNTYGWVNPNTGTVRIPIDQAIDMVAQKGLPSKPSPAGSDNDGYRMIPSDASGGRTLEKISR